MGIPVKIYEVPERRKPGECEYLVPRVVMADLDAADAKGRLQDQLEKSEPGSEAAARIGNAIAAIEGGRAANVHDLKDSGAFSGPELLEALGGEFGGDLRKAAGDLADGDMELDPAVVSVVDDRKAKYEMRSMLVSRGSLPEIKADIRKAAESRDPLVPPHVPVLFDAGRCPISVLEHLGYVVTEFGEDVAKADDDRYGSGSGPASIRRTDDRRRGSGAGPASVGDDDPEYGGANDQQVTEQEQARDINVRNRRMLISGDGDTADVPSTTELLRMVSPRSPLPCMACGAGLRGLPIIMTNQARCKNCSTLNSIPPSSQVPAEPRTRRATVPTVTEKSMVPAWEAIEQLAGGERNTRVATEPSRAIAKSREPAPRRAAAYDLATMTLEQACALLEAGA